MIRQPEIHAWRGTDRVMAATATESDITTIETAADALIRSRDTQAAIKLYALALRLRSETGLQPQRRADD